MGACAWLSFVTKRHQAIGCSSVYESLRSYSVTLKKVVRNANVQIVSYAFLGSSELDKTRSNQSC